MQHRRISSRKHAPVSKQRARRSLDHNTGVTLNGVHARLMCFLVKASEADAHSCFGAHLCNMSEIKYGPSL
jgi:hypothetical protein